MPTDPQEQLDALKRSMCGDCGVGPFKGGPRNGLRVSQSTLWIALAAGIALTATVVALVTILR